MKNKNVFEWILLGALVFAFVLTACEQDVTDAANTNVVKATVSPSEERDAFRAKYAETLDIDIEADLPLNLVGEERLTDKEREAFEAAVSEARAAYRSSSHFAQSLLIKDKAKLDAIKARLAEIEAEPYTVHSFDDITPYLAAWTDPAGTLAEPVRLILGEECVFTQYKTGEPDAVNGNQSDGGNIGMTRYTPLLSPLNKYVDLDLSHCSSLKETFSKTLKSTTIDDSNKKYIVVIRLPSHVTGTVVSNKSDGGSFAGYTNLKKAYIPGITTIGKVAFYPGCANLEYIYAPKATHLGEDFTSSNLKTITLGKTPPGMDGLAFQKFGSTSSLTIHVPYGTVTNDKTQGWGKWWEDKRGSLILNISFVVDEED
jgi:hypothetical protein